MLIPNFMAANYLKGVYHHFVNESPCSKLQGIIELNEGTYTLISRIGRCFKCSDLLLHEK